MGSIPTTSTNTREPPPGGFFVVVGSGREENPRSDKPARAPVWTHAVRPQGEGRFGPSQLTKRGAARFGRPKGAAKRRAAGGSEPIPTTSTKQGRPGGRPSNLPAATIV